MGKIYTYHFKVTLHYNDLILVFSNPQTEVKQKHRALFTTQIRRPKTIEFCMFCGWEAQRMAADIKFARLAFASNNNASSRRQPFSTTKYDVLRTRSTSFNNSTRRADIGDPFAKYAPEIAAISTVDFRPCIGRNRKPVNQNSYD